MTSSNARPFADSVLAYAQAGWPCIMPVPLEKSPPPVGFTGADGRDTDPMQLVTWAGTHAAWSIALRMPDGVIGIDVDDYAKGEVVKRGAATLAQLEARLGPLPATWSSTARGQAAASRIRFYRVPAQRYVTRFPDVEIIQRHHRYAVVWPSPHPSVGDIYRWYDPTGAEADAPPKVDELPELPAPWIDGLREGATDAGPSAAPREAGEAMLTALLADERPACPDVRRADDAAREQLHAADVGSRHDAMTARAHNLVMLGAFGHHGTGAVLAALAAQWAELTAGEDRGAEFERMLLTSARKAVTVVGADPVANDPCLLTGGIEPALPGAPEPGGPAPVDDRPGHTDPDPIEAARELHPHEIIGAQPFTPREQLDQLLADAVLERMWPVLRYGYDERGWLKRQRVNWEQGAELAEWAVTQVAATMPRGNPDAEKGSEDRDQADKRKRLMTAAGAGAVAKMMRARVAGGAHPCALRVADLDAEPWLLWAGGLGWDLTLSLEGPVQARIDPATPHLRSAGVVPDARPTPLWDAFTAAVWPDPALRAWALRVLSIAVTGYADRALPILVGERGRGKTQAVALLMSVLGNYAHAADPRLLNGLDNAHASIIYALKGRRLSFIDEGPREGRLGQERLKQLTGGGDLTGNQMNRNPITFTPTHTLVLTANDDPVLTDPAVRDRVRLIPCEGDAAAVRAARRAIGHTSSPSWRSEAPGVLAAMMREAAAWLADPDSALNDAAPAAYRERVETLVAEQDPVRSWVEEETETHPEGERAGELYQAFVQWARNNNHHAGRVPTPTKWGKDLTALGYPATKDRDGKRRPLRLRLRGGWLPGAPTAPQSTSTVTSGDQSVTSQSPNWSHAERPETQAQTHSVTGVTREITSRPHTHAHTGAHTRAHETDLETGPTGHNRSQGEPPIEPPAVPADTEPAALSPAQRLALEYHELREAQRVRLEAATRGALHDRRGRDSEEVLRYFGEGEFKGDGTEQRLTWPLFLEQRRPGREFEKAQQAAWEAGARLGRRHAMTTTPTAEADYDHAVGKYDPDTFAAGYTSGIYEHDAKIAAAAGELVDLPALVTRDGTVTPIGLDQVDAVADTFGWSAALTVDVETTGYPLGHADYALRTIQLGNEHAAVVLDADNDTHLATARTALTRAETLHAHSATADLIPLAWDGALDDLDAAWDRMHDTVIPAKLADPASTGSDPGLKQLAGTLLRDQATSPAAEEARAELFKVGRWRTDVDAVTPAEKSGWAQVNPRCTTMVRYAASDVLDTAAIARRLPAVPPALLARERTAQRMTARVTHDGVRLDPDHVHAKRADNQQARQSAAERVQQLGVDNPGSPAQIAARLNELGARLPHTKAGNLSVAKGVIEAFRRDTGDVGELTRAVLDWRHHNTALVLLLDPYHQLVTRGDGRARPTIYTLGADTGRMSCVRPNLQQVSRQGGIRSCITADPGELIVSADFASVEVRVGAALTGDPDVQRMLIDGVDLHMTVARQAYGPGATKEQRYETKRGVFGYWYGSGIPGIARTLAISESEAAAIVASLDAMTPVMRRWIDGLKQAVRNGLSTYETHSGRVVHLDPKLPHKAFNYCVQGTARELLIDALMRWRQTPWGHCRLLPVHDEVLVFVPEDQAADAQAALVACMQSSLYGVEIKAEPTEPSFAWQDAS